VRRRSMVGTIVLEKTDRVGDTARGAAAGDLRAEASALYPTDGNTGSSRRLMATQGTPFGPWSTWVP
jgi:hypothetical protein